MGTTGFEAWDLGVVENSNATEGYEHSEMKAIDLGFRRRGGLNDGQTVSRKAFGSERCQVHGSSTRT